MLSKDLHKSFSLRSSHRPGTAAAQIDSNRAMASYYPDISATVGSLHHDRLPVPDPSGHGVWEPQKDSKTGKAYWSNHMLQRTAWQPPKGGAPVAHSLAQTDVAKDPGTSFAEVSGPYHHNGRLTAQDAHAQHSGHQGQGAHAKGGQPLLLAPPVPPANLPLTSLTGVQQDECS